MTQDEALSVLKLGVNVYLTGTAGSGKTHLLDTYIAYSKWRGINVGVTASTGVAATHLSGQTINSWAGIGIKREVTDSEIRELMKRKYLYKRLSSTEVLIIDEVSMLPSYTLEAVDRVLRFFKHKDLPFGGIQVILCGDFFQLPPVQNTQQISVSENQKFRNTDNLSSEFSEKYQTSNFIFTSPLWEELDLTVCYLDKPYRQDDKRFLHMLSEIRNNEVTSTTWATLKERFFQSFPGNVPPTKLYTHNINADRINQMELEKIPGPAHAYHMESTGNDALSAMMRKNCLAPEELTLKKGALVMFVKNNFEEGYVNGTLGKVIDFTEKENYPVVETFSGNTVKAVPAIWEIDEEGSPAARIKQIPLRLAWAITIHKSQGMTLDAAEIDLGKSFVEGLGYVALSRVRSLNGIKLRSINRTALSVNDEVIKLDKKLRQKSDEAVEELRSSYWYKKNHKTKSE